MRAVLWVQGCEFSCTGCIVPESWKNTKGEEIEVDTCAVWLLSQPEIEGVTLSGGEPMLQAAALVNLIDTIQAERSLGIVCYTGFRFEQLQYSGNLAQRELLHRIDLLIDGPYIEELHDDLLWRGSRNQRLLPLSNRYRNLVHHRLIRADHSAGLEFVTDASGEISFAGVPSRPGFRSEFESRMRNRGILIQPIS